MNNKHIAVLFIGVVLIFTLFFSGTLFALNFFFSEEEEEVVLNGEEEENEEEAEEKEEEEEEEAEEKEEEEEEENDISEKDVLEEVVTVMSNTSSFAVNADIKTEGVAEGDDFNINLFANVFYAEENVKGDVEIDALINEDYLETGAEIIILDDNIYMKVLSIPQIIEREAGFSLSGIEDAWIMLTRKEIEDELHVEDDLQKVDIEKILEALQKDDVYAVTETNEGYYRVTFNESLLSEIIWEISGEFTVEEVEDFFSSMEEDFVIDVWIDEDSYELQRLSVENRLSPSVDYIERHPEADGEYISFSLDLSFSQFNEEFEFNAPEEHIGLEELFIMIFMQAQEGEVTY